VETCEAILKRLVRFYTLKEAAQHPTQLKALTAFGVPLRPVASTGGFLGRKNEAIFVQKCMNALSLPEPEHTGSGQRR